jgi:hypothetical protein
LFPRSQGVREFQTGILTSISNRQSTCPRALYVHHVHGMNTLPRPPSHNSDPSM